MLSIIPLALLIVSIGFCVYRGGLVNLLIIPFWLIQFSCAVIYLLLAFGDYDKVRIRVQRLLIVFCLLQTWIIYNDLYIGYMVVPLFQQILILLWPVVIFIFFNISERVKGIGRLFICYVMVFLGMWLLAVPHISDMGLEWEMVKVFYLLLTADVIIISENRRQHQGSKKLQEHIVISLINAAYLTFVA